MTKPIRVEINCETGEVQEIELTDAEIADMQAAAEAYAAEQAIKEAEAAELAATKEAAHAKLIALGLTAEEISALSK